MNFTRYAVCLHSGKRLDEARILNYEEGLLPAIG